MKKAWILFLLFLWPAFAAAAGAPAAGKPKAVFSAVTGDVKVITPKGHTRLGITGHRVYPGDAIQIGTNSQASVSLPDGSSLDFSADSSLTITSLNQPAPEQKNFLFDLAKGRVLALVQKLLSSNSSFEMQAGGVVCGVRGTQFSMNYNLENKQVELNVFEGKVGATCGGITNFFSAGQGGHFLDGHWDGKLLSVGAGSKGNGGNNNGGNKGSGGNGNSGGSGNNGSGNGSQGSGGTGGTGTGNPGPTGNGAPPGETQGPSPTSCLDDLNTQFSGEISTNCQNALNSAFQNTTIHLVVPPQEGVP